LFWIYACSFISDVLMVLACFQSSPLDWHMYFAGISR
jgi:hypothetical protein